MIHMTRMTCESDEMLELIRHSKPMQEHIIRVILQIGEFNINAWCIEVDTDKKRMRLQSKVMY